jgi:superfamily II DNA/RNA helicase
MTFKELGLNESLQEALSFMGFENATPVQEQAIPIILDGKDILACAQTGTGKTAAFILPILNMLSDQPKDGIKTLVIAPTRELAMQIEQQVQGFSYFAGVSSIAIYGGGSGAEFNDEKEALKKGTDIIVGTPGKLISHLNMGYADFSTVEYLVLDEADRMLDMGFFEDIQRIVKSLTGRRQTLLFSATFPPKIKKLAQNILNNHEEIRLAVSKPAEGVLQAAYLVHDEHKTPLIKYLIDQKPNYESIIIFTGTKKNVNNIVRGLSNRNYEVKAVSSDLVQKDREDALRKFKSKQTRVLVATDVLSRGIDIKGINLVINYDVPGDGEDYVHRIGRTARADSTGVALTLVNTEDMYKMRRIERLIESEVPKLTIPPEIGKSPEWDPNPRGGGRFKRSGGGRNQKRKKGGNKKGPRNRGPRK